MHFRSADFSVGCIIGSEVIWEVGALEEVVMGEVDPVRHVESLEQSQIVKKRARFT